MTTVANDGLFVAIESGHSNVTHRVLSNVVGQLSSSGHRVMVYDFDKSSQMSRYFVGRYYRGDYGDPQATNPYIATILHIVDFYDQSHQIVSWLNQGKIVIATNYIGKLLAQESSKFASPQERARFFVWCDQLMYETFGLPRPEKCYLMTDQLSPVYSELAGVQSRDYKLIDLVRGGEPLSPDNVTNMVYQMINELLPESNLVVDETNQPEPQDIYQLLITTNSKIIRNIESVLEEAGIPDEEIAEALRGCRTVGEFEDALPGITELGKQLAVEHDDVAKLNAYSEDFTEIKLVEYSPKQEFDILPNYLFGQTDLSISEIKTIVDKLIFAEKDKLLAKALNKILSNDKMAHLIRYKFEILSSFDLLVEIHKLLPHAQIWRQTLTPRYGYSISAILEEHDLLDDYMTCFDNSMEAHSQLEVIGEDAEKAVLTGYKLRWMLELTAKDLISVLMDEDYELAHVGARNLLDLVNEKCAQKHPALFN